VVQRWRELGYYLFTKYNDRYINDVGGPRPYPRGVGYPEWFNRKAVEERPGYYEIRWRQARRINAIRIFEKIGQSLLRTPDLLTNRQASNFLTLYNSDFRLRTSDFRTSGLPTFSYVCLRINILCGQKPLLAVENLSVEFTTDEGLVKAVQNVSFDLAFAAKHWALWASLARGSRLLRWPLWDC
jgi:hypothetical protein